MNSRISHNQIDAFLKKQIVAAKIRDLKWREKNNIVKGFVFDYLKSLDQDDLKRLYKKYYEKDGTPKKQQPSRSSKWSQLIDKIHL